MEIKGLFGTIADPRHEGYVKHKLSDVLIMVMGGVVCGMTELADIMVYFDKKIGFYKERFNIEKYPSKPTLSRILNMVDGDAVGKMVVQIMREHTEDLGEMIAADGKAIRSTRKKDKAHSFLQILTAYATESGVTLSQESISYEDKTNEIPVFQSMLDNLDVKGKTITADAMHCQKDTCGKIVGKGGDYAFGLKGNQGGLFEDVKLFLTDPVNQEETKRFETLEKNGGRIEKRVCVSSDSVDWIPDLSLWSGLNTVFSITRTITAKGKTTEETGFYISSLPNSPEKLLSSVRSHWMIESMHWSLDVIWHEDGCGILSDNGHKTLNAFRKFSLLGHKKYIAGLSKNQSVKGYVLAALLDDDIAFDVLPGL